MKPTCGTFFHPDVTWAEAFCDSVCWVLPHEIISTFRPALPPTTQLDVYAVGSQQQVFPLSELVKNKPLCAGLGGVCAEGESATPRQAT